LPQGVGLRCANPTCGLREGRNPKVVEVFIRLSGDLGNEMKLARKRDAETAVYGTLRRVVCEDGGGNPASYPVQAPILTEPQSRCRRIGHDHEGHEHRDQEPFAVAHHMIHANIGDRADGE
jgi:hypothetical protein